MHPGSHIEAVYLCREPVDFRKSINGLSALVQSQFSANPFGTSLHVFVSRRRDRIKALYWHRNGFCLWYKRLECERFAWPLSEETDTIPVTLQQLEWLLEGFDLWSNRPHETLHYTAVV